MLDFRIIGFWNLKKGVSITYSCLESVYTKVLPHGINEGEAL